MIQAMMGFLVSVLDTVMVSSISNEAVSAVYATNQITFFVIVVIGGVVAGSGVFIQQFYGAKKEHYITETFRYKLLVTFIFSTLMVILSIIFGDAIVKYYARNDSNKDLIFNEAMQYKPLIIASFIPTSFSFALSSSVREVGQARMTLYSSVTSVVVNIVGNAIFIYGLGLGVKGAAIATFISRIVELIIIIIIAQKYDFYKFKNVFSSFHIDKELAKDITKKSIPMLLNELSWATAMILISFAYSFRENILSSLSIINSITNIFGFIFSGLGIGISILVGTKLGANEIEEAKKNQRQLLAIGVAISIIMGIIMIILSPFIPKLFTKVTPEQQSLSSTLIRIYSLFLPAYAIAYTNFMTLRTGGKTFVAFLIDSGFVWVFAVTLSLIFAKYTSIPAAYIYLTVQIVDLVKALVGLPVVLKGYWANNLTTNFKENNDIETILSKETHP
jgi:putative MATE family efflux protein